jgi:hypothetical protein
MCQVRSRQNQGSRVDWGSRCLRGIGDSAGSPFVQQLTTIKQAIFPALAVLAAGYGPAAAQITPNAPIVEAPGSEAIAGGPTVWNQELSYLGATAPWSQNQEVTALAQARAPDPYFLPKGIPLGAFRLYPNLETSVSYDDNVFRVNESHKADFSFAETPSLDLHYDTHEVQADLYGDSILTQYGRLSTVNSDQYDFGTRGTYNPTREFQASANVSLSQLAEPLGSTNGIPLSQSGPTMFTLFDASAQSTAQFNRLGLTFGGSADTYTYFSTPIFGGAQIGNHDRDRTIYTGLIRASHDFPSGASLFLEASYNSDQYEQQFDRAGIHRSSDGYQVNIGGSELIGNLIEVRAFVGYLDQNYDHHQKVPLADISGVDFGGQASWFATESLTVGVGASRQIEDTTVVGASGGDDRNVNLKVDYEWTRRILLSATGSYDDTIYEGSAPLEHDRSASAGVQGKWLISHYISASASYQFIKRSSTIAQWRYTDNTFTIGIEAKI